MGFTRKHELFSSMTMATQKSKTVGQHTHRDHLQLHLHPGSSPFGNVCDCPMCMAQSGHRGNAAPLQPLTLPHDMASIPSQKELNSPGIRLVPAAELFWKSRLKLPKQSCNHQGLDLQPFVLSSLASLRGFPLISVSSMEEVLAKAKYKEVGLRS